MCSARAALRTDWSGRGRHQVHIRCPNRSAHTTPGADGATFVTNAGQANNRGFVVHCRHAHCDGKDRLFFVKGMLAEGWLSISDSDQQFIAPPPEDAGPSPASRGCWRQTATARQRCGTTGNRPCCSTREPFNPAFPIDAIPTVLRCVCGVRAEVIGADPCALSWAPRSVQHRPRHRIRLHMKRHDAWSVPPFLWVALVGAPSSKKTPILDAAFELSTPSAGRRSPAMAGGAQALQEALPRKERAETPEPVCRRRLISHDATIESLQDILGQQDRGVGVLRDELAGWIGSLEKIRGRPRQPRGQGVLPAKLQWWPLRWSTVQIPRHGCHRQPRPRDRRRYSTGPPAPARGHYGGRTLAAVPAVHRRACVARLRRSLLRSDTTTDYIDLIDRLLRIPPETRIQLSDAALVIRE